MCSEQDSPRRRVFRLRSCAFPVRAVLPLGADHRGAVKWRTEEEDLVLHPLRPAILLQFPHGVIEVVPSVRTCVHHPKALRKEIGLKIAVFAPC